ncbi:PB1 domain, Zinc finger, ZZ-type, UBA-like, Next to BRCA1, central domain protein [Artemisia annua]|uniref:PB1 domain, Zinc finger, ZZ-type, UBA-like, Next to BRCA1, central domain protein n=1 Tax=Artemisia annua TaxID=35608 RepID=A0A2U1N7S9_ARTAN|nr:PB1 domain, Zinc finger, ZZ-type, UBA-like, Next to BRCA1, central domain protein [Artemisia annua]
MPLQINSDSHGHHRYSRGPHWKRDGPDNNGIGTIFHRGVRCDDCGVHPITGPCYKSKCLLCHMGTASDYVRIDRPSTNVYISNFQMKMKRDNATIGLHSYLGCFGQLSGTQNLVIVFAEFDGINSCAWGDDLDETVGI